VFLGPQKHIATEYCGQIDPDDLDEYQRHARHSRLCNAACRWTTAADHRGGAAERSARARRSRIPDRHQVAEGSRDAGEKKYMICNGDEGDPGAFMDRMLLESFPYRIIEGMAIAALAVGAHEGYLYIRAEYPLAVKRIREAIEVCRPARHPRPSVLGSDFALELNVMEGAGAFVCGEETACWPRCRASAACRICVPPYPAEQRPLGQRPTLINNVETYAMVPWILRTARGLRRLRTAKSKGTKVFALAGKVARGGLIEVPMGVTLASHRGHRRRRRGRQALKAVQVGGPSGGCVPAELCDTPIDFEALAERGAIMGSGGLVVLDEDDCMVDIARYFLRFTQDQSCGKCTFCRVGTRRMLDVLDRLCDGQGRAGRPGTSGATVARRRRGSLCGLGKTAPNPVLSTLKYFRDEYEAHIEGRCPAGRCTAMIAYKINDRCIGCTLCAQACPVDAIPMTPYRRTRSIGEMHPLRHVRARSAPKRRSTWSDR
jgi:NADH-quinone oxidoreductase subunit F